MSRKTDLEDRIRTADRLIREYIDIQRLSPDPNERERARRGIETQHSYLKEDLEQYARLCHGLNFAMEQEIIEIALIAGVDLVPVVTSTAPALAPAQPPAPASVSESATEPASAPAQQQPPAPAPDRFVTHPAFDPQQTPDPQQRNERAMQLDREGKDERDALNLLHPAYWAQRIEPGVFEMGDDQSDRNNEKPAFSYTIEEPYALARFPVTNRQYALFLKELVAQGKSKEAAQRKPGGWKSLTGYDVGSGSYPVMHVDWKDACAFAAWADAKLRRAGVLKTSEQVRLPTEPEWERAAAYPRVLRPGSSASMRRRYPWGNTFEPENPVHGIPANTEEAGIRGPSVVGIFPHGAADCGAEDMAGNVWEWCSTPYQRYPLPAGLQAESINTLPKAVYEERLWVVRGGSWYFEHMFARCTFRFDSNWFYRWLSLSGVRLARLFSS